MIHGRLGTVIADFLVIATPNPKLALAHIGSQIHLEFDDINPSNYALLLKNRLQSEA
jgi:hypothetical protein